MCNFELLQREIRDICKANNIDFRYTELGFTDEYQFEFMKENKGYTLTMSKQDIYTKPFVVTKIKIEHVIYSLLNTKL